MIGFIGLQCIKGTAAAYLYITYGDDAHKHFEEYGLGCEYGGKPEIDENDADPDAQEEGEGGDGEEGEEKGEEGGSEGSGGGGVDGEAEADGGGGGGGGGAGGAVDATEAVEEHAKDGL